jgi:hypothetical protein
MARTTKSITSMTVHFGGPPILCDQGLADDRDWFGRHHGRNRRIRPPIGGERDALPPGPPKCTPTIVVRQLEPGKRVRVQCWVTRRLNSEALARCLFDEAAEGWPAVAAIEAAAREGRL